MLSIMEDYLQHRGWGYERLDGSTALTDRQVIFPSKLQTTCITATFAY
jgi:SNF2 family DNA or RNA helicase